MLIVDVSEVSGEAKQIHISRMWTSAGHGCTKNVSHRIQNFWLSVSSSLGQFWLTCTHSKCNDADTFRYETMHAIFLNVPCYFFACDGEYIATCTMITAAMHTTVSFFRVNPFRTGGYMYLHHHAMEHESHDIKAIWYGYSSESSWRDLFNDIIIFMI
jgi:hypothetical protein